MLFRMPLQLLTLILDITAMMGLEASSPASTTASYITMSRYVLLRAIMNLMRGSHNALFRSRRYNHTSWLLILNRSLCIFNLFF